MKACLQAPCYTILCVYVAAYSSTYIIFKWDFECCHYAPVLYKISYACAFGIILVSVCAQCFLFFLFLTHYPCLFCSHAGVSHSHSITDPHDSAGLSLQVQLGVCVAAYTPAHFQSYLFPIFFSLPVSSADEGSIVWRTFADARHWKWNKQSILVKRKAKPDLLIGLIHLYMKAE